MSGVYFGLEFNKNRKGEKTPNEKDIRDPLTSRVQTILVEASFDEKILLALRYSSVLQATNICNQKGHRTK